MMYSLLFILPFISAFTIKFNYKVPFICEVHDVNINKLDLDTMDNLKHLLRTTPVLVFKKQQITPQKQFEFCSKFDTYHTNDIIHPFPETAIPNCPQVTLRGTGYIDNVFGVQNKTIHNGKMLQYTPVWHQDLVGTRNRQPTRISSIYMIKPSLNGGTTLFASMEKAYENMGANAKRYKSLQACYSTKLASSAVMDHRGYCRIDNYLNYNMETFKSLQDDVVVQPLVIYTDKTRRKETLMLNPVKFCGFLGLPFEKSKHIMHQIMNEYVLTNNNVDEIQYEANDFVLFDNRRVMHSSTPTRQITGSRIISLLLLDTKEPIEPALPHPLL